MDLEGNKIVSKDLKGKVVIFNFWFTTCKPCVKEIPELNELVLKHKNNTDVVFYLLLEIKKNVYKLFKDTAIRLQDSYWKARFLQSF